MPEPDETNSIFVYVVYRNTSDYPGEYVVRGWRLDGTPGPIVARGKTLKAVRRQLPPWMTRLNRNQEDDATIVETWL